MLAGNATIIPADLQPFYRQVIATTVVAGDHVFTINWAWLIVFLAFSASLLIVGVSSVAIESTVVARPASRANISKKGGHQSHPFELQSAKTYSSTVTSGQHSPQWAQGVMHDVEAATAAEHSGYMHR